MNTRTLCLAAVGLAFLAAGPAAAQQPIACSPPAAGLEALAGPDVGLAVEPWTAEAAEGESPTLFAAEKPKTCIPASKCCKVCSKGQACGNSCISREYTCHKGRGCACNSSEVC